MDMDLPVFSFGLNISYLTFPVYSIGNSITSLIRFANGKLPIINSFFSGKFYSNWFFLFNNINFYIKPIIFLGTSILYRSDNQSIITALFHFIKYNNFINTWKSFNVVSVNLGLLSSLEFGLSSKIKYGIKNFLYLCGTDNFDFSHRLNSKDLIIYQGPFFSSTHLFKFVKLLLPSAAYTESNTTYINLEGRYRFTSQAVTPFKQVRTDLEIITALFFCLKSKKLNNFSIIPNFDKLNKFNNLIIYNYEILIQKEYNFNNKTEIMHNNLYYEKLFYLCLNKNKIVNSIFALLINNYYNFDFFTRNSKIMGLCALKIKNQNF